MSIERRPANHSVEKSIPQKEDGQMARTQYQSADRGGTEAAAHSIHPIAIRAATVASVWFVIAMAVSFSGTIEADYLLAVVVGFSVIFFTLVLSLAAYAAAHARGGGAPDDSLDEFLSEEVAIDSGSISGKEAMVQLLTLPVTLAIGATAIGFIFVASG
jgi:hypothetical protein